MFWLMERVRGSKGDRYTLYLNKLFYYIILIANQKYSHKYTTDNNIIGTNQLSVQDTYPSKNKAASQSQSSCAYLLHVSVGKPLVNPY